MHEDHQVQGSRIPCLWLSVWWRSLIIQIVVAAAQCPPAIKRFPRMFKPSILPIHCVTNVLTDLHLLWKCTGNVPKLSRMKLLLYDCPICVCSAVHSVKQWNVRKLNVTIREYSDNRQIHYLRLKGKEDRARTSSKPHSQVQKCRKSVNVWKTRLDVIVTLS